MSKSPKRGGKPDEQDQTVPFDDALRRILASPPKHKAAKKKAGKKK